MEALLPRFRAAHTQVLGISVDSHYCHANWGRDLGGVSFPLLSDFQPKGAMAGAYGAYLDGPGITDRATVILDKEGVVRYAVSVTPGGSRKPADLAAECEKVDKEFGGGLADSPAAPGLAAGTELFVKSQCGHSRAALIARDNLHLQDALPTRNVTEDAGARDALVKLAGKDLAPALAQGGKAQHEAVDIIRTMVDAAAPL